MSELGFKGWCAENKVRQTEIAEVLDISYQTANAKVNGKTNFTLPQIKILCDKYGVSADIFVSKG